MNIVVDGIPHTATIEQTWGDMAMGRAWVLLQSNPQEFEAYARAAVYDNMDGYHELDSRDGASDTDGTQGEGQEVHFIVADIQLKGLTWMNRPCDVYDHINEVVYPNTEQPYHIEFGEFLGSPSVEYSHAAVYLKGTAPSLKLDVEPLTGTVPVRAHVMDFELSPATPGYPFGYYALLNGSTTTIPCPPLKNEVNVLNASLKCNFDCQFQDGYWAAVIRPDDEVNGLKLYAVYAQPRIEVANVSTAPDDVPWISVLEDACQWAAGRSTYNDVARSVTTGLYFSGKFIYDAEGDANWLPEGVRSTPEGGTESFSVPSCFLLKDFLNAGGQRQGNCMDVSHYLCICANMVGLQFKVAAYAGYQEDVEPVYLARTNPLCVIGRDPTVDWTYGPWDMEFHQINLSLSGTVYDASEAQKLDLTGASYRNPPFNWPLNAFWQNSATSPPTGVVEYMVLPEGGFVVVPGTNPPQLQPSTPKPYGWGGTIPAQPYTTKVWAQ